MGSEGSPKQNALAPEAFEYQPTPIVVLANDSTIILINRACRKLFQLSSSSDALHVKDLPIRWQDGTEDDFLALITQPIDYEYAKSTDDDASSFMMKLQVSIYKKPSPAWVTSCMLVTDFSASGEALRMLSFENIKDDRIVHLALSRYTSNLSSAPVARRRPRLGKSKSYSGIVQSTPASQLYLTTIFSQLRDAFFFNDEERSAFVLSADETFAYPSYNGSPDVVPVEIDNLKVFFRNWDVWDPHFKAQLPLSEYPAIWLNKYKVKFRNRRYGLKEEGKDLVLDISGDPLFHRESGIYLGGVVWIKTLGEYKDVVASDLKASLADIRTICDRLPHLIWTVDANGDADYFSQSWYDFTGLTEAESVGRGFTAAIDPTDMAGIWAEFAKATASTTECLKEAKYRRHDGKWIWMFVRAKPLVDDEGHILKWYGTSTEVHSLVIERLEAERKKSQMMEMLSLQDIGLFAVSSLGRLDVLEGRMDWLTGRSTLSSWDELDEKDGTGISMLKTHLKEMTNSQRDYVVFEGQIQARWYKFRLATDVGNILGCSVDVTEQRKRATLETENARLLNEAALEIEKGRLKTSFLAHMSHEIRTPIAGIIGTADMLDESCVDDSQKEAIGDIKTSANNLLTIVNDILDLSKIEAGQLHFEKQSFDAYELVLQVKRLFITLARSKRLDLKCVARTPGPLTMIGDPGRVTQIVTNLVSNATKFSSQGSVEIFVETNGNNIRIAVKDTGDGISPETMATLFQPFAQGDASTARRYGGTGLGLVISRSLAHRMGGLLTLESKPLEGTTAILLLPKGSSSQSLEGADRNKASSESGTVPETESSTVSGVRGNSASQHLVLVVEDNAINQKVTVNLVRKLGYRTKAAWNGQEALKYVETYERPSAILMDCQMPLMDGYEATQKLRTDIEYEAIKSVPIIALTASVIKGDREKCQAAGMDDYISKPIDKSLLDAKLKKWITS